MRRRRRQGWRGELLFRGKGRSGRCACWCAGVPPASIGCTWVARQIVCPPCTVRACPGLFQVQDLPLEPCYPAFDPLTPSSPHQAAHAATVHAACVCTAPRYPAVKGTCSHGTARCLENANRRDRIRTRDGNCGGWGVGDGASGVKCGDRREPLLRPFSPGGLSNASTAPKPLPAFTSLCACVARCSVTDEAATVRLVIAKGSVRTFAIFCPVYGHHATPSPNYRPNEG